MRGRRLRTGLAAMAWLAAGLALTTGASARLATGGWTGAGQVQARGGPFLTDAFGRRLQLHGVNLVAKCGGGARPTAALGTPCVGPAQGPRLAYVLSPTARDPGRRFTAADARTLARLGFNAVRLGIIWEGLEPGRAGVGPNDPRYCAAHRSGTPFPSLGSADPYDPATVRAYLARTDRIVALLSQVGIRVVIDMHQDAWGSAFSYGRGPTPWNGEGAPAWATCTDTAPYTVPVTWGEADGFPAVQAAMHHFWANDVRGDLQGQFARVWQAVARHYRSDQDVIGYEVINEPNDLVSAHFDSELQCDYGGPVREPRSCAAARRPAALRNGLIGAIQAADPNHVVLFEPSGATNYGAPESIGIAEPLRFRGLALAFHMYGSPAALLAQAQGERDHTRTEQPGGPPAIMDEFGASNDALSTAATVSQADAANLSWTYWSALQLHDPTAADPFEGLLDQQTRRPYPGLARALAVPYPWATAGTPGAQSFDPARRRFGYSYTVATAIRAPTEIAVPPYTYPRGYAVRADGARVVSRRGAPVLKLAADRGATRVNVTIRPVG